MTTANFKVRNMTRGEMDIAVDWAAKEGWNPGIYDAQLFYPVDRGGFFSAVEEGSGKLLGVISAVKYGKEYAFIGFFIVRPECRGKGIGFALSKCALTSVAGINTGLDGVLNMVDSYAKWGFSLAHKNSRFMGINGASKTSTEAVAIRSVPTAAVLEFDTKCFGFKRHEFIKNWITQPGSEGAAVLSDGKLRGYGLARKCREGFKIGPLFADDREAAECILDAVLARLPRGEKYFLDVPGNNAEANDLAVKRGMSPVFSTARMYSKCPPDIPTDKIFGITSFELG